MEWILGLLVGLAAVQTALIIPTLIELRAFREMNEALGGLLLEIETAQTQMRAGIMAAILERANADLPEKGSTAH
jgi:hypothetical protein